MMDACSGEQLAVSDAAPGHPERLEDLARQRRLDRRIGKLRMDLGGDLRERRGDDRLDRAIRTDPERRRI
jgi:hypothetical protein